MPASSNDSSSEGDGGTTCLLRKSTWGPKPKPTAQYQTTFRLRESELVPIYNQKKPQPDATRQSSDESVYHARRAHRKSRLGCGNCKRRRVKVSIYCTKKTPLLLILYQTRDCIVHIQPSAYKKRRSDFAKWAVRWTEAPLRAMSEIWHRLWLSQSAAAAETRRRRT